MTAPRAEAGAAIAAGQERRRRAAWLAAWLLLGLLHLVLVFQFIPPAAIFSSRPIQGIDFSLHYYQADRANTAHRQTGRLWGWDPHQLAGYPAGTVEDMSSKTMSLFVIALTRLGVPQGLAYNLYILLMHLLIPPLAWAAARLWGLGRGAAFALGTLWVLLWTFDSFIHWCWYCGMISWALVSALAVVVVGLICRVFQRLEASWPRAGWWLGAAGGCALIGLFHPLAMAVVALPGGLLYLRRLRRAAPREHLFVAVCIASATLAALLWLLPALPIWRYVEKSEFFLRPSPAFLLYDFFDLHLSASATGPPVQTMFRFLCLAGAAVMFWRWRRAADPRLLPLLVLVLANLLLAYLGRYFWLTSTAQPYRAIAPATFAAAVPAAVLLAQVLSWRELRALSPLAKATVGILGLLLVARGAHLLLFYFPGIHPFMYFERRLPVPRHPVNTVLALSSRKMESHGPPRVFNQVRYWLEAHHGGRGRVLVEDYELGEYLAATTDLPIIGGFAYRPLQHAAANLFRYEARPPDSPARLREHFERYAIGFVVMHKIHWSFEKKKELLRFRTSFNGIDYRIFSTNITPSYLARGRGRVVRQELNRIAVEDAGGAEVVLRFHWLDSLRCRPACRAEPYPVTGSSVGFIRVPRPPPRFEIYNSYVFR